MLVFIIIVFLITREREGEGGGRQRREREERENLKKNEIMQINSFNNFCKFLHICKE